MSQPGYGNQGGQSPDPQWGNPPQSPQAQPPSDPWAVPAQGGGEGGYPSAPPVSGAEGSSYPPQSGAGAYQPAQPQSGAGGYQPDQGGSPYPPGGTPPQYSVPSTGYVPPPSPAPTSGYPTQGQPGQGYPGQGQPGYPAQGFGAPGYPPSSGAGAPGYGATPGSGQTRPIPTGIQSAEVGPSALGASAPRGRSKAVILLSVVTALLVVLGVTMTSLFVVKGNEQEDTQTKLSASKDDVRDRDVQIAKLKTSVNDEKTKRTTAEQKLKGTESSLGSANSQKQTISQCLRLLLQALDAASKGDKAKTASLTKQLDVPCTKAEKLL